MPALSDLRQRLRPTARACVQFGSQRRRLRTPGCGRAREQCGAAAARCDVLGGAGTARGCALGVRSALALTASSTVIEVLRIAQ